MTHNILEIANQITSEDRQKIYGDPATNFAQVAAIFNAMTGRDLDPSECVLMLMAVKLARLRTTPDHLDSMVDLAGYAWVLSRVTGAADA